MLNALDDPDYSVLGNTALGLCQSWHQGDRLLVSTRAQVPQLHKLKLGDAAALEEIAIEQIVSG